MRTLGIYRELLVASYQNAWYPANPGNFAASFATPSKVPGGFAKFPIDAVVIA